MQHHTGVPQEVVTFALQIYTRAQANQNNLLNKRTESISKFWHRNKLILKNTWHILNWFIMEQSKF